MQHITEKLHQDHQKVEKLFQEIKKASDGAQKTRADLCEKIKNELEAHAEFEEEVFYPAVREIGEEDAEEKVEHGIEEHDEMKELLGKLEDADVNSDEFMQTIAELERVVKDHVKEEETEIFPLAKKAIKKNTAEQMSRRHDEMIKEHMQAAR